MASLKNRLLCGLIFACLVNGVLLVFSLLSLGRISKPGEVILAYDHVNRVFLPKPTHSSNSTNKNDARQIQIHRNKNGTADLIRRNKQEEAVNPGFVFPPAMRIPFKIRDSEELVQKREVPSMVYYTWCGNQTFGFSHYLGVLSTWYTLEPDVIEIHYEYLPLQDKYNNWLTSLRFHIPVFNLIKLSSINIRYCGLAHGLDIVLDRGGLYINDPSLLLLGDNPNSLWSRPLTFGVKARGDIAFVASTSHNIETRKFRDYLEQVGRDVSERNTNSSRETLDLQRLKDMKMKQIKMCKVVGQDGERVLLKTLKTYECFWFEKTPKPVEILTNSNKITELTHLGSILWGNLSFTKDSVCKGGGNCDKTKNTDNHNDNKIPNIVHYIWFGSRNVTFSMYLSFLSTVRIVKPRQIFLHGDLKLYGHYWDRINNESRLRLVYREPPRYIFGHRVLSSQHQSDIVRADVLDKYGGIYLDWDAFWLKSPEVMLQSGYDVILSRDHIPRPPFPDTFNLGVVLAKPRSSFIRKWRAALVNYRSTDFLYNAVELPYKVYERDPQGVKVEDHLQVMCFYLKCHPSWNPDFRQWHKAQLFDWTRDALAIHFTHPDPPEFDNETALMTSTGMFADIGRFILGRDQKAKVGR